MAKLLRSNKSTPNIDALRWLFAVISATRRNRPDELPEIQQRMIDLGMKRDCEKLSDCEETTIRSLARSLYNSLDCRFPHF